MSMQNYMRVAAQTADRHYQGGADIVIVGNGIAGLTAAIEARRYQYSRTEAVCDGQAGPRATTGLPGGH
ncbi:MAG: hypothetical protein E6J48_07315 [Chloroflexi bacterium]|nr:MAG: hypothetical protein E6J48_07315 [Chloroflexota bacterium]